MVVVGSGSRFGGQKELKIINHSLKRGPARHLVLDHEAAQLFLLDIELLGRALPRSSSSTASERTVLKMF